MSFGVSIYSDAGELRLSITDRLPRYIGEIMIGTVAYGATVTLICPEQENESTLCAFSWRRLTDYNWDQTIGATGISPNGYRGFSYTNSNIQAGIEYRAQFLAI